MTKTREQRTEIRDQREATATPSVALRMTAEVREIGIENLYLSPSETRKTVDPAALKDLAASIAQHGIQEPLLVRPVDLDCMTGEPLSGTVNVGDGFEIVAGQRRWLAAKIAGKTSCPCIVSNFTDAEAHERRIISNLQREDLPALEEATAFSKLLCVPGATVETVAAKLGKSPSYVGRRLKLLDAIEPVREALKAGAIEVGHAMELARLDEKQQARQLDRMNCGYLRSARQVSQFDDVDGFEEDDDDFDEGDNESGELPAEATQEPASNWHATDCSVAELRREIARTTLIVLVNAPFPLDDELPPMACTDCPKRSGNAVLLFDDCAQDTCTDRECYDAKVKVWVKAELEAADKAKQPLVMLSNGWSENKAAVASYDVCVVSDQKPVVPCMSQEYAIWVSGSKIGHRAMICRDAKCKRHNKDGRMSTQIRDPESAKAERKKLPAKLNAEKKYRAALFSAVATARVEAKHSDSLNLEACIYALGRAPGQYGKQTATALGWDVEIFSWKGAKKLREELLKLSPFERLRAALVAAHSGELAVNEFTSTGKPDDLEKLAALLGVDAKKIRAGVDGKSDPAAEKTTAIKPMKPKVAKKWLATPAKASPKKAAKKAAAKPTKKAAKKAVRK